VRIGSSHKGEYLRLRFRVPKSRTFHTDESLQRVRDIHAQQYPDMQSLRFRVLPPRSEMTDNLCPVCKLQLLDGEPIHQVCWSTWIAILENVSQQLRTENEVTISEDGITRHAEKQKVIRERDAEKRGAKKPAA
jgi:hypothetical protein